MYLSNTTLFDGRTKYWIYYIKYNYMFRSLTMAIFRLYMKYLVSSYTRFMQPVMNLVQLLTKNFMDKLKMAIVKRRNIQLYLM